MKITQHDQKEILKRMSFALLTTWPTSYFWLHTLDIFTGFGSGLDNGWIQETFFFFFGRNLFCAMNCHILLKLQTYISECRTLWIFLNSMACILDTSILVQFQCIPFMLQNLAKEVEERHFLNLYQVNVGFLYRKGAPNQSTKICKASTNRKREKLTKIQSQQVA